MSDRAYDVVLYGASGFTGRQTVEYFARHVPAGTLRWAIAGRDGRKLNEVRAAAGRVAAGVDVLVADGRNQRAIDELVERTRVVLTTAGPFSLYGGPLVDACVRFRTHYVDITGETSWVRTLIDRYHERAEAEGTRIVPFCGFDSVPSDIGTFVVANEVRRTLGTPLRVLTKAFYRLRGGLNGGTVASAMLRYESGGKGMVDHPFLLNPVSSRPTQVNEDTADPRGPRRDEDAGTWVGPFIMGRINSRVVRRSAALFQEWGQSYGRSFDYQEYQQFSPPRARLKATIASAGLGLTDATLRSRVGRALVRRFLPAPGGGPSEEDMNNGWFRCELVATDDQGRKARGVVAYKGDPSNRATVCFLCESALCLALDFESLPGGPSRGGILTPATAFGDTLVARLRAAGVTIDATSS